MPSSGNLTMRHSRTKRPQPIRLLPNSPQTNHGNPVRC